MCARTNRCYNERGSRTSYFRSSIAQCILQGADFVDLAHAGLLLRYPYPSHPGYGTAYLHVLPYHYRKRTTGRSLFLIQYLATYPHNDIMFLEHGTRTRLLDLLPVARNPGIFRKLCTHGRKCQDTVIGTDLG
jgi:hypothetical protein